jgi:subtilisin family serine protease
MPVAPRRAVVAVLVLALLPLGAGAATSSRAASAAAGASASRYREGALLVAFRRGVPAAAQKCDLRLVHGDVVRRFRNGSLLVQVPAGRVQRAVARLRGCAGVRFAEPDYLLHEDGTPNDPSLGLQWGYSNTGQTVAGTAGTPGADEKAVPAWNVTTGSRSVAVAEVDSGVEYTHPDLAANIWTNPGGIGGCPAGTHGYNVVASSCDPMDDETAYNGHGTHVAGIIGAVGNNGIGVTGVDWTTTVLPVKWLDSSGSGTTSQLLAALDWVLQAQAAGVNVRVVNDSATFFGTAYSQALSDEIDLLGQHSILFVAAAGNTGDNNDDPSVRRYPCGYDRPTEICVTASNQNDALPSWANYGPATVDLAAPGDNVYSTLRHGSYGYISGGSMAAPQVSGAAALILSVQPSLSVTDLRAAILNNVDPIPALANLVRTGGRLDICKALPDCSPGAPVNMGLPVASGSAQQGSTLSASTGSWQNAPASYAYQWLRCDSTGATCGSIAGATQSTYQLGAADVDSTLRVQVTASNASGSASAVSAQTAVVAAPTSSGTLGTTTVGGSSFAATSNQKQVNEYSLPVAVSVSKLTVYLQPGGTSGKQTLKGVLYADNGGAPGALLAVSSPLTYSSTQAAGWYDLTLPAPASLGPGAYWIGTLDGSTSKVAGFRYTSVSGSRAYNSNTYGSGASNPFGSASKDSRRISLYATYTTTSGAAPVNAGLPVVTGSPQQGSTLSASTGSWQNSPSSYAYQWLRCDSAGATCGSVAGATQPTYQLGAADVGSTMRAQVTASNASGSASAVSAQTAVATASSGTFGTTTVGAGSDAVAADRKRVNRYSLPVAASVSKLTIYLQPGGTSGSQVFEGVLYADSGGAPGTLLAVTAPLTFSSTQAAGWYDLTFSTPVALAAGSYWIGTISGSTTHVAAFRYTSVTNSRDYNTNTYTSGPSDPFGPATVDSEQISEYASYTTA